MSLRVICAAMVMCSALSSAASAQSPPLTTTEAMIPSSDPGIKLYVRNKHAEGMTSFSPDKTLLFIHGATYPAETSFDLPIDGASMMGLFAQKGFDVYLVDVRSYGRSMRPPEMDQPPEANKPIATSEEAGADLGAAVDYVLGQRDIPKLDLMGWSWGTSIAGAYTASHNDKINRLVLYAPAWVSQPPVEPSTNTIPAYRLVAKESARTRWLRGVPEDKKAALIPREFSTAGGTRRSPPTPLGAKWSRQGFARPAASRLNSRTIGAQESRTMIRDKSQSRRSSFTRNGTLIFRPIWPLPISLS
jgi:pimeloyl-ACP methyl ester carboxylesterase